MSEKWAIYDELLDGIAADLTVQEIAVGSSWTMVRCEWGCGVAMTMNEDAFPAARKGDLIGASLRDAAALIKSWNFKEASLGHAALNACYNSRQYIDAWNVQASGQILDGDGQSQDAFLQYQELVKGKKVAAIGHFAGLERRFGDVCELSILEREPKGGDYPDTACEYILPEQDFVFMTGNTLTNKTLPRLLELSRQAKVILCGPSTVLSPVLLRHGVDDLAGFLVEDATLCRRIVREEVCGRIFDTGRMLRVQRPEIL